MSDTSYFICNADKAEKDSDNLSAYFQKAGCCSGIRDWVNNSYFSVVRKIDLTVNHKVYESWIETLIENNFPITEFKENDLIPKETDLFSEKTVTKNKIAQYAKHPNYRDLLVSIEKSITKGNKIFVRGTDRGEDLYYWTATSMKKGQIIGVDNSLGLVTVKILEHDLDLLHGDSHDVELQVFNDYDSNIPMISELELGEVKVKKPETKYLDGYLIKVDSTNLSSKEVLAVHSLIRYGWHTNYTNFIDNFFTVKKAVPEATFFELLLMVSFAGNYSGYHSIFEPNNKGGFMPSSKIVKNLNSSPDNINGSVYQEPKLKDLHANAIKFLKAGNWRKGYEDMLVASYGSKNKELRTIKALSDFGQLTKKVDYTIIDENYSSYKVTADDFSFRWYKKERFSTPKIITDFKEPKPEDQTAEAMSEESLIRRGAARPLINKEYPPYPSAGPRVRKITLEESWNGHIKGKTSNQ